MNPFPSGWMREPEPEVGEDLRSRRAQVFDTNWWEEQDEFKNCNESFIYFDEETGEERLKHGAEQFCLGKIALPWKHEPFIRGERDEHEGVPWQKVPSWRDISVGGIPPSPRYRHASSVVGPYLIIFGGYGPDMKAPMRPQILHNDVHIFDVRLMSWISLVVSGKKPSARAGHAAATLGVRTFFFGGYSKAAGLHNDAYILQVPCKVPTPDPNAPPPSLRTPDQEPAGSLFFFLFLLARFSFSFHKTYECR